MTVNMRKKLTPEGSVGRLSGLRVVGDVTRNCGFWDDNCRKNGCGAGMWVKMFTQALGWHTVLQKLRTGAWWEFSGNRNLWVFNVDCKY